MCKPKVDFNWVHYANKLAHCCCWSTQNLISRTYRSYSWPVIQSLLPIRICHTYANKTKTYHPVVLQIQFWALKPTQNPFLLVQILYPTKVISQVEGYRMHICMYSKQKVKAFALRVLERTTPTHILAHKTFQILYCRQQKSLGVN